MTLPGRERGKEGERQGEKILTTIYFQKLEFHFLCGGMQSVAFIILWMFDLGYWSYWFFTRFGWD